ncbi:NAD(P)-binding domain-containing protein [Paenibacillus filicis]|uniref:NAD(P)-binding domain-containing protein n=1 Tax=Paenibacillus gyeongsangnamensis TaxID=3388067 RepID=A0ABT4QA21_9BACL|nr:NAD(P)-binding domain-containing protein [Paenibacillus filicis]MCZ8513520.1 NAD(P)-binding domain-containing protein [Paenibacillus filicis]
MYKLSVVGTGRMGRGLVRVLSPLSKESDLIWGSRTPDKARALIDEEGFRNTVAGGYEEALGAEVILHSLWFRDVLPWAKENREALKGKILVDIANPFTEDFNDFTTEWGTSAAEELQKLLPQTRVVGAFKNTFFRVLEQPLHNGLTSDVYVTGDDEEAKRTVLSLLDGIPFRVLDGGRLSNNRTIERMTLFEREVAVRYGNYPYVSFRMFGLNEG